MRAAICFFGGNKDSTIDQDVLDKFYIKFPNVSTDLFTPTIYTKPLQDLKSAQWMKRQAEIKCNQQYDVVIGLNLSSVDKLLTITNLDIEYGTLYFTNGNFTGRTSIDHTCFYSRSMIFDRAAEFCYWTPPEFLKTSGEQYYWYLKTWKIRTICCDIKNFKIGGNQ